MAIFLAKPHAGIPFDFGQAEFDLLSISKQDSGLGFDEINLQTFEGVDTVPVTYPAGLKVSNGITPDRLHELVNDTGFTSPPNIIILAVNDGDLIVHNNKKLKRYHGLTLKSGAGINPFQNHIALIYDVSQCNGHGYWVREEGTIVGKASQPPETLLYHELSHAFRIVTNAVATPKSQEEKNARIDENYMRDVLSLSTHRAVGRRAQGCGGGMINKCCIVASLSTGSPYSSEVNRFRHFRDYALRRGKAGDDFFKHFHYHYYGFSPEVCRLMGHQPALSPLIREYFVVPLLAAVELLIHYAEHKGQGMVGLLRQQSRREEFAGTYRQTFLNELAICLNLVSSYDQSAISTALAGKGKGFACIADLLRYVNEQNIKDEFIKWALVDVLRIWLFGASLVRTEKTDIEINAEIYASISEWISRLPVTSVWEEFSRLQTESELNGLEQFIFDRKSKEVFAERLIEKHPKYSTTIRGWAEH